MIQIQIPKPTKNANSAIFLEETGYSFFQVGDEFFLAGDATEQELLAAFAAHNPPAPAEPTVAEKLASVGLSLDDLRAALGLT